MPHTWLYAVSKNKARDFLKHNAIFSGKIVTEIKRTVTESTEPEIDLSERNIYDSQLQMMFAICHPCISVEAQIGLSLSILCGFGVEEIADALLTGREAVYKQLSRAKEKLKNEKVTIELPVTPEINKRLETVLTTLYLLFSEGYYSTSQNTTLRSNLCLEAMRLNLMLLENDCTNTPSANALLALMCFHSSRFDARTNQYGDLVLYQEQDETLWNRDLIEKGEHFLNLSSKGNNLSKYHLEAAIAWWHTRKRDTTGKWENILQLYNKLLQIEYSPIAALNRTYALSKANGKKEAIAEAEKLNLPGNHLFHSLLGNLYEDEDDQMALQHLEMTLKLAKTNADKAIISSSISRLNDKWK